MKNLLLLVILVSCIREVANSQTIVNYTASTAEIQNPGRGFMHFRATGEWTTSGTAPSLVYTYSYPKLTVTEITNQRINNNITLIFRLYYLREFKSSLISNAYLKIMQDDMDSIRKAGAKAIVRFAYSKKEEHGHTDDANLNWVLQHLTQLKPLLQKNSDVILTLQAGFIGAYGEWYFTHNDFSTAPGVPNYPNRKKVSDSLLKILPIGKTIQIRAPYYKYNTAMYGNGSTGSAQAITVAQAYSGTVKSRIGHHNDCFVANISDYGTYVSSPISLDKDYIDQDSKYTIMGGETCNDDVTYTNCTNAKTELSKQRFTYLNNDYNTTVLNRWKTTTPTPCFDEIKRNLGYRMQLVNGTYTNNLRQGYTFNVQINFKNIGYATLYEEKKLQLILKNTSTNVTYPLTLPTVNTANNNLDNRYWLPSAANYKIDTFFGIGLIPNGNYDLYFAVKDTGSQITDNPLYSIRFANQGSTYSWDATNGYNYLKSFTVSDVATTGTAQYTGVNWFGTPVTVPIRFENLKIEEQNNKAKITWSINDNNNWLRFEVERSDNGIDFSKAGSLLPTQGTVATYVFTDLTDLNTATTFYRLKFYNKNGDVEYSTILKLKKGIGTTAIGSIYPQPAKDIINIEVLNAQQAVSKIYLYNVNGKMIHEEKVQLVKGYNTIQYKAMASLPNGVYSIKIINNNQILMSKIIKH
jgi:hypothetical protein